MTDEVLPHLTIDDLKSLGLALGEVRMIKAAIEAMKDASEDKVAAQTKAASFDSMLLPLPADHDVSLHVCSPQVFSGAIVIADEPKAAFDSLVTLPCLQLHVSCTVLRVCSLVRSTLRPSRCSGSCC